ncbi:MAG: stage II sporulation protein M, partial [Clostridiaceae bacterium]|nr:stage II sporulation protein M [Clostridiaceae bacterium]
KSDARTYLEGFLDLTSKNELQSANILKQSIKFNLYFALVLFFSGLVYIGILFIPILIAFRGFCIGFSIAFLTENFGNNGFLLSLGSVLPQNFIYVPVTIVMGVIGLNYSLWAFKNKYFKKFGAVPNLFATYAFSAFVLFILLIAGSIVEAYITSMIVKMIIPYIA